jgi:hypothetical protein
MAKYMHSVNLLLIYKKKMHSVNDVLHWCPTLSRALHHWELEFVDDFLTCFMQWESMGGVDRMG